MLHRGRRGGGQDFTGHLRGRQLVGAPRGGAQNDPGGTLTVAADVRAGDTIFVIPLDTVPITATLDPDVPLNEGAILEFAPDQTRIPVGDYEIVVTFENSTGDKRITWKADEPLTIEQDRNRFGV